MSIISLTLNVIKRKLKSLFSKKPTSTTNLTIPEKLSMLNSIYYDELWNSFYNLLMNKYGINKRKSSKIAGEVALAIEQEVIQALNTYTKEYKPFVYEHIREFNPTEEEIKKFFKQVGGKA